ncbi:MAG TPA: hypothetical protein VJQ83_06940 [Tepidiformaceae bacterium]|nr:hypothetical protein [Tepidiformaceae bacterium]
MTLHVYADVFDRVRHTDAARTKVEAAVGNLLETNGGDRRRTSERTEAQITPLRAVSSPQIDGLCFLGPAGVTAVPCGRGEAPIEGVG